LKYNIIILQNILHEAKFTGQFKTQVYMLAIIYFTTQHIKSKLPLSTILYPHCYIHECIRLVWSMDTHIT